MSELISGKEALNRVHECVVQYKCDTDPVKDRWTTITDHFWDQYNLGVFLNNDTIWKFRLKPRTITINGIEVPAPFEPKEGEECCFISDESVDGYHTISYNSERYSGVVFGLYRPSDIEQVVAALRSIFK